MTLAYQLFSDSLNSVPFSLTPQNGVNSEESNVKPFSALVKEILACAPKWSLTEFLDSLVSNKYTVIWIVLFKWAAGRMSTSVYDITSKNWHDKLDPYYFEIYMYENWQIYEL